MILPTNFEDKTGFDVIRRMLSGYCLGESGKQRVADICFSNNFNEINQELHVTDEFRTMLLTVFGYPASEYFNLEDELNHILIPGTFLQVETLMLLRTSYSTYCNCVSFISKIPAATYPKLHTLVDGLLMEQGIVKEINRVLDNEGRVRDNASATLLEIRKELSRMVHLIDKKIAQALNQAKLDKLVPPETEIAIREGHAVIPVQNSY